MFRSTRTFLILLGLTACSEAAMPTSETAPVPIRPAAEGADQAGSFGASHVEFLPPVTSESRASARFDDDLLQHIVVEICELSPGAGCGGVPVVQLRPNTRPAGVRLEGDHYSAPFHTGAYRVNASRSYRARVLVAGTELGFIDIRITSNASQLRDLDRGYVGVVRGQTLPIRFRIVEGTVVVAGSEGGDLTLADGAVRIDVPAGALTEPVGFTADPVENPPGIPGIVPGTVFRFGPEGIRFQTPITVSVKFDPALVPEDYDAGAVWLHKVSGGDLVGVRSGSVDTVNGVVTGQVTGFSEWAVAISTVRSAIINVSRLITQLASDAAVVDIAVQIRMELVRLSQLSGFEEFQFIAAPFYAQSVRDVCVQYDRSTKRALASTVTTYRRVSELMKPVASWHAIGLTLPDYQCDQAPGIDEVFRQLATKFTSFYNQKLEGTELVTSFSELTSEIHDLALLANDAQRLGVLDLAESVKTETQHPLGNALRERAYNVCRTQGNQQYLAKLYPPASAGEAPYTHADVVRDVQLCGSELTAQFVKLTGEAKAPLVMVNGTAAGASVLTVATRSLKKGSIQFHGSIRPLRCPDSGTEKLIVRVNNTEIHSQDAGETPYTLPAISLEDMHTRASIDPSVPATHRLEIVRSSDACGGSLGPAGDYVLASADLRYPEIEIKVVPENVTVQVNGTQQFDATVTGSTRGVTWEVNGGGTISSSGVFRAGSQPGVYTVTATSIEEPTEKAEANVTIRRDDGRIRLDSVLYCNTRAEAVAFHGGAPDRESQTHFPSACSKDWAQDLRADVAGTGTNGIYDSSARITSEMNFQSANGSLLSVVATGNADVTAHAAPLDCPGCGVTTVGSALFSYVVQFTVEGVDHVFDVDGTARSLCGAISTGANNMASTQIILLRTAPSFEIIASIGSNCFPSGTISPLEPLPARIPLQAGATYQFAVDTSIQASLGSVRQEDRTSSSASWNYRITFPKAQSSQQ